MAAAVPITAAAQKFHLSSESHGQDSRQVEQLPVLGRSIFGTTDIFCPA